MVSMKSGLRDRNNMTPRVWSWEDYFDPVSMKSGLRDRNNTAVDIAAGREEVASQ